MTGTTERKHVAPKPSIPERFWSKVDQQEPDACWPWLAYVDPKGYGMFRMNGKMHRSHRVAYMLANGSLPARGVLDHICRNRSCCNPAHLRNVTVKQNNENLSGAYRNNKAGIRGVRQTRSGRWEARVTSSGRTWSVTGIRTAEEAAQIASRMRREILTCSEMDRP